MRKAAARIPCWILRKNRHPPRSLSGLCGGDPPTVTQAAPSVGSDWVTVQQKGGDGNGQGTAAARLPAGLTFLVSWAFFAS
jgi:hypothetical protein